MKNELNRKFFVKVRNWFIDYLTERNEYYKFGAGLEAVQFKNIVLRIYRGLKKKYPDMSEPELEELTFNSIQQITIFADEHGYVLTALNIITKFNNIIMHIKNESTGRNNKGFNPDKNAWISSLTGGGVQPRAVQLPNKGVRQIGDGSAGSNLRGSN